MNTTDLEWMESAECATIPGFTEFPEADQRAVCYGGCPVRSECLTYALDGAFTWVTGSGFEWPVYGGMNAHQLRRLQRARGGAIEGEPA